MALKHPDKPSPLTACWTGCWLNPQVPSALTMMKPLPLRAIRSGEPDQI
jgi:hypothetical protein